MNNMVSVQFSHANGFPSPCYRYLFSLLPEYQFSFVEKMGHGDYPLAGDIKNYAHELINDIRSKNNPPLIGVGHSAGAVVTLLAAAEAPELFQHVILLDPVLFSKRKRFALKLVKHIGLMDKVTPAGRAEKRRMHFATKAEARSYFENKSLFQSFHPQCFDDYIEFGLEPCAEGFRLAISPEIEADVFRNVLLQTSTALKQVHGTVIYGQNSDLFQHSDQQYWQRNFPNMQLLPFDGGHLFPFEQPEETAAQLKRIITRMNELK